MATQRINWNEIEALPARACKQAITDKYGIVEVAHLPATKTQVEMLLVAGRGECLRRRRIGNKWSTTDRLPTSAMNHYILD